MPDSWQKYREGQSNCGIFEWRGSRLENNTIFSQNNKQQTAGYQKQPPPKINKPRLPHPPGQQLAHNRTNINKKERANHQLERKNKQNPFKSHPHHIVNK